MISFDEFETLVYDISDTFPEVFFRELSGGIMVKQYSRFHPASVSDDLYVMGEYHVHPHLGRYVVIYYGSFRAVCGYYSEDALKEKIRSVLLHEFRHHLESLAGERDLEYVDQKNIRSYLERKESVKSKQKE